MTSPRPVALYVANTSWYLFNFRRELMTGMSRDGWDVVCAAPPDSYSSRLNDLGFQYVPLRMSNTGTNPFSDVSLLIRLARLYRRLRPTLVHHFTIKPVIYGSIAARLTGIPAVINAVPGIGFVYTSRRLRARILRPLVSSAYRWILSFRRQVTIFQNRDDLNLFVRDGRVRSDRALLIRGSGVDPQRFVARSEPVGIPSIVFCARLLRDKGLGNLVDAARIVRQRGVSFALQVIGDVDPGHPGSHSEREILTWEHEGLFRWIRHCDEMPLAYAASNIVVLPTTYGEGVPRILVEAASCARPLIATDWPGCREIVQHGITGLLVPPHSASALADALQTLILDAALRKRLGSAGRELVLAEFSSERVIRATRSAYESLLPSR
jgi:glycosyltransferase involved in cell wall biosynthesis